MTRWLTGRRLIITIVGAAIVLTCIIFSIPFNTVTYYTTETYYDTEINQEPYPATEPYVSKELTQKEEILFNGVRDSVPYGISVPFTVPQDGSTLTGRFELPAPGGFYLYASAGQIVFEQLGEQGGFELSLKGGEYRALLRERISWEEKLSLSLKLTWMELEDVIKYREVTRYRDVSVQVEKQRTVTNYKKASLWQIIFGR